MEFLVILSIYRMNQRSWITIYRLNNIYPYKPFTIMSRGGFPSCAQYPLEDEGKIVGICFCALLSSAAPSRKVESHVLAIVP